MSRNDNGSHTAVVTLLGRNGADKSGRNEGPKSAPLNGISLWSSFVSLKEILMQEKLSQTSRCQAWDICAPGLSTNRAARLGPDGFESLLVSLDENSQEVPGWLGCCFASVSLHIICIYIYCTCIYIYIYDISIILSYILNYSHIFSIWVLQVHINSIHCCCMDSSIWRSYTLSSLMPRVAAGRLVQIHYTWCDSSVALETLRLSSKLVQWSKHWESWGTSLAGSLMDVTWQWISWWD